jgi:hypothetical protein
MTRLNRPPSEDELYGDPWQTPEEREERTRKRHAYWLSILTDRDWARIAELAEGPPAARLEDLDAPGIAVGVCELGWETRLSGERIGTIRGKAVLVWLK